MDKLPMLDRHTLLSTPVVGDVRPVFTTREGIEVTLPGRRQLQTLANRMAERAVSTGRPSVLEPMTPADRRIVHITLADHKGVTTESSGEGSQRHVTIRPAGGGNGGAASGGSRAGGRSNSRRRAPRRDEE